MEYKNNFKFTNSTVIGFPEQTNSYGAIVSNQQQFNLMLKVNRRNIFSFSYWGLDNDREVPQNMTISFSDAKQYDKSDRVFAALTHTVNNFKFKLKHSYLKEDFNYTEFSKNIDSYYIAETSISDFDIKLNNNNNNNSFNIGAILTSNTVLNNNYLSTKTDDQNLAIVSSFKINQKSSKTNLIVRKEWHSLYEVPLVPTIGYQRKINNNIRLRSKVNRSFRAPTFNDRYWISGGSIGNLDLLPETAWNKELGIDLIYKDFIFHSTIYSLDIEDMIVWQPNDNNIWQPINNKKVWSRGIENKLKYRSNKYTLETSYTYTKSTNEKKLSALDNSYQKQLLYVPLQKLSFIFIYKLPEIKSQIIFGYVYNDQVLTSYNSSNDKYLDGFSLSNLSINKELNNLPIYISFKINNLMDTSYQTCENYPNPGREYLLTINYKIN